jgi:hypothetical protein
VNWDALSAIAALIGGAGVVVTLIYLAIEIRQNTRAVRSASYQSFTDSINEANRMCCEDAELRQILAKAFEDDYQSLTQDEQIRVGYLWLMAFRVFESFYYQHTAGTVPPGAWENQADRSMRDLLRWTAIRQWWQANTFGFLPEFESYVEKTIGEVEEENAGWFASGMDS